MIKRMKNQDTVNYWKNNYRIKWNKRKKENDVWGEKEIKS